MSDSIDPPAGRHAATVRPTSAEPSEKICLVCGGVPLEPVCMQCRDRYLGTPGTVNYLRCTRCGLVQQSPLPRDVRSLYRSYPVHARKRSLHRLLRRVVLSGIYYSPPPNRPCALIDYGCGDGGYLDSLAGSGIDRFGFELDADQAANVAAELGVPVESDRGRLIERMRGATDVVTMHFVLEHLTDLNGAFDDVRQLLRSGGLFYFVIPQVSSLEARLFGRRWHGLDPPRHISFPEPDVVAGLARRHGFEVISHRPVPFPNGFAGSVPAVLIGRFNAALFAAALPAGIVFSRLFPGGARAFLLKKK